MPNKLLLYIFFIASAQGNCAITPLNSTTGLNAYGGGLAIHIGTKNVMIQCNCTYDDGRVVNPVRWYDPDGTKLISSYNHWFDVTVPHFTRAYGSNTHVILVIPTFNDSYVGTYNCGRRTIIHFGGTLGTPNAAVTLTIVGGLMYVVILLCHIKSIISVFIKVMHG